MGSKDAFFCTFCSLLLFCFSSKCLSSELDLPQTALVEVDASWEVSRKIPDTLFGLFFEEINHAGAGGIWAELVSNRSNSQFDKHSSWKLKNSVALRMEILCENCPAGGVGIYNPGFWGMNIEEGKTYNLVMYIRSLESVELTASLTCSDGMQNLASVSIQEIDPSNWTKIEMQLLAQGTCRTSRLELTSMKRGVIWFDQVSLMPSDTYKGHGFRKELIYMLLELRPQFLRFPGISHHDEVDTIIIEPFVKDVLDSLEFARGSAESTWGSVRSAMGHPERFPLKYVAIGNEDCGKEFYRGNYLKFYDAIRKAYPDIQMISNCDGSSRPLDHPADLYDFHVFVSEYAVNEQRDAGKGSLLASLAEAAFLTGLEKNSDVVQMASYAPLFVNDNDSTWNPDAIVFNSWQQYGTPSYWVQTYFRESSGSVIHPITISSRYSDSLAASAITWQDSEDIFLRVKIVNFGPNAVNLTISSRGLQDGVNTAKSTVVPVESELPNAAEVMEAVLPPFSFTSFDLALDQYSKLVAEM
uniref:non-reducing end alpha-L-arabinofuranosidase n=1 Tax=Oryza nivara TaxID=4536 RepID=A0A0E0J685_ORYNI